MYTHVQINLDLRMCDLRNNLHFRKIFAIAKILVHKLFEKDFIRSNVWPIFKLADRMRSMRTNGASKNRDYSDLNGCFFLLG